MKRNPRSVATSARALFAVFSLAILGLAIARADDAFDGEHSAGDRATLTIDGVEFAFRYCPPGSLTAGSPDDEPLRLGNENFLTFAIDEGFWLMETEVTQAQWRVARNPNSFQKEEPVFKGDDLPVENVSWTDCDATIQWLNVRDDAAPTGWKFAFPTQIEWEYACRAETSTPFWWGNALNGDKANCNGELPYGVEEKGAYLKKTAPVRSYEPNPWGLCDMSGNVWEWCSDAKTLEIGGVSKNGRAKRGGSWFSSADFCRAARRDWADQDSRSSLVGVRFALKPTSAWVGNRRTDVSRFNPNATEAGTRRVATIGGVDFAFRYCPPGSFEMGSSIFEGRDSERPKHYVTLTKGFWLLETEATQAQWRAITGASPSFFRRDKLPVESVSWSDCQEFVKLMNEQFNATPNGWKYALPTEAQWEYACRAGTTEDRVDNLDEYVQLRDNDDWKGNGTQLVGSKKPNSWGFYDMFGNVWEWCEDRYVSYTGGPKTDPIAPDVGIDRVIRGGGRDGLRGSYRPSVRAPRNPDAKDNILGVRIALVPIPGLDFAMPEVAADDNEADGNDSDGDRNDAANAAARASEVFAELDSNDSKAGDRRVISLNGAEFALRYCPPGEFAMGSPDGEGQSIEHPQRVVSLTRGFWIMETELTQRQWEAISGTNPSFVKGDDLPVSRISWNDCQEFVQKLNADYPSGSGGWRFSLPTEAQWEYACRAGTTDARYGELDEIAWYSGNSDRKARAVGEKAPNFWGIRDMIGNVAEWTLDRFGTYYGEDVSDPTGPSVGEERIYRGGACFFNASVCRAASRAKSSPEFKTSFLGARLALVRGGER